MPLTYRPDLDGLRAVAVIAVALFHAKLGCPGGWVGVDVFFVISGLLITSLILRDIDASQFRAIDFWERRVRRIVPALTLAMVLILVAGWFVLLPDALEALGRAAAAQAVFGSNIHHWRVTGYFRPQADELPLLHTWTLAVEEQFYFLLPIAILVIAAWRRTWIAPSIALMCLGSFALCVWAIDGHRTAAFYLLPTRAWELLLGSLLAAGAAPSAAPRWLREVFSIAGLAAVVLSVLLFDAATPFPTVAPLVPTLGTVALVWACGAGDTFVGRALSLRPLVFVGKVSYSFYLLHWPALVFPLYWFSREMGTWWKLGVLAGAFALAVLSWAFVENPIRNKRVLAGRRALFSAALAGILLPLGLAALLIVNEGFPSRFDPQALAYAAARHDMAYTDGLGEWAAEEGRFPEFGDPAGPVGCMVWGDSHAMAIMPAVIDACRSKGLRVLQATHSSTAPLLDFANAAKGLDDRAAPVNRMIVDHAIRLRVGTVILAASWNAYVDDEGFAECLAITVRTLQAAGLKVVIVRQVPAPGVDVPRHLARTIMLGEDVAGVGTPMAPHRAFNRKVDEVLVKLAGPGVVVLDPTPWFADTAGLCRAVIDGVVMYRDSGHLTVAGARRLSPMFAPHIGR